MTLALVSPAVMQDAEDRAAAMLFRQLCGYLWRAVVEWDVGLSVTAPDGERSEADGEAGDEEASCDQRAA